MKYCETFEPNGGFRLHCDKRSFLLCSAMAYGQRLDDEMLNRFTEIINSYVDSIQEKTRALPTVSEPLTLASFPSLGNAPFYKFIDSHLVDYYRKGSLRFGSAKYYRDTENVKIQDDREGYSTIALTSADKQLTTGVLSGFNCAILCGTSQFSGGTDVLRHNFGECVIEIVDVAGFAARVCELINASRYYFFDVKYADNKIMKLPCPEIEKYAALGNGDLNPEKLRWINEQFHKVFYDASILPSLFSKPVAFRREFERRIVFELDKDLVDDQVSVSHVDLASFISIRETS